MTIAQTLKHCWASPKQTAKKAIAPLLQHAQPTHTNIPAQWWDLTAHHHNLSYKNVVLHDLLEMYGSPLFVFQEGLLQKNVVSFHAGARFHKVYGSPVFYSYKTHPVPGVLKELHAKGMGAEVISPYELWLAEKMGVPASRIVYNGPAKSDDSLEHAVSRGVFLINANHREELLRIEAAAARVGKKARVGIRIQCGVGWSGQFGVSLEHNQALDAYRYALQSQHLKVVGVHAHRGGHIHTAEEVDDFVSRIMDFCKTLHAHTGFFPEIIDVGGSLAPRTSRCLSSGERARAQTFQCPLPAHSPWKHLGIEGYVEAVYACVDRHMASIQAPAPWVVFEPGKALTANTHMLLTTVQEVKHTGHERTYAVLDAGINVADGARFEYHQVFPLRTKGVRKEHMYTLTGPICTPGDVLYGAWPLPLLEPGNSLALMDAGAYWVPFSTSFSFPQPALVGIYDDGVRLLRHAESYQDMVRKDVF